MKLALYLDNYNYYLHVMKKIEPDNGNYILVSERDPDEPIEFKTDCFYFNPLLRKGETHLYSLDAQGELTSIYSGKPIKTKAAETRAWFTLYPINLRISDIHPDVSRLITRSPKLTGVIAQVARATMNLRIPSDLGLSSKDAWVKWICDQKQILTPTLKNAFGLLHNSIATLTFAEGLKTYLETGKEPEPIVEIKIRWCEIREVKSIKRQLYESPNWSLRINPKLLENQEELLAYAGSEFGSHWDQVEEYKTGEDIIEEDIKNTSTKVPLIFVKEGPNWRLLSPPVNGPTSIHDMFNEAIAATLR
jgi:hypothetical protein